MSGRPKRYSDIFLGNFRGVVPVSLLAMNLEIPEFYTFLGTFYIFILTLQRSRSFFQKYSVKENRLTFILILFLSLALNGGLSELLATGIINNMFSLDFPQDIPDLRILMLQPLILYALISVFSYYLNSIIDYFLQQNSLIR